MRAPQGRSAEGKPVNVEERSYDFGVVDNKGRALGADVQTFETTFHPIPEERTYWSAYAPGTYFGVWTKATRNRKKYGAYQSPTYYTTREERDAHVERYVTDATKRAQKIAMA